MGIDITPIAIRRYGVFPVNTVKLTRPLKTRQDQFSRMDARLLAEKKK